MQTKKLPILARHTRVTALDFTEGFLETTACLNLLVGKAGP